MMDRSFFEGVPQEAVEVDGHSGKVPCFYYDDSALSFVYTARLDRLRELLPDSRYQPLRVSPRRGVVAITVFEYRETDIGPYNELSVAVALEPPDRRHAPFGLLRQALRQRFHAFVVELPVTTEIARRGGVDLYNYPKFLATIDFRKGAEQVTCSLAEGDQKILTLSAPKLRTRRGGSATFYTYPSLEGRILQAKLRMNQVATGTALLPSTVRLDLVPGHRVSDTLASLGLGRRPLQYQYLPEMQAILFPPEPLEAAGTGADDAPRRAAVA